eukprot:SAG31_NODE_1941_length_6859_cov_3.362278_4_plen_33_part_00
MLNRSPNTEIQLYLARYVVDAGRADGARAGIF